MLNYNKISNQLQFSPFVSCLCIFSLECHSMAQALQCHRDINFSSIFPVDMFASYLTEVQGDRAQ